MEWASDSTRERNFRNIPPRFPGRLTAAKAARPRSKFSFAAPFRILIFFRNERRRSRGAGLLRVEEKGYLFASTVFITPAFHTLDFIRTILTKAKEKRRNPTSSQTNELVRAKIGKLVCCYQGYLHISGINRKANSYSRLSLILPFFISIFITSICTVPTS